MFRHDNWIEDTISNLIKRYSDGHNYQIGSEKKGKGLVDLQICSADTNMSGELRLHVNELRIGGHFAIICGDFRGDDGLIAAGGIEVEELMRSMSDFKIRELVVVTIEDNNDTMESDHLNINHRYILIYRRDK